MMKGQPRQLTVLAAAAHPDDIEFMMAGTLLLLKKAGAEIHLWNIASGSCGTTEMSRDEIVRIRSREARDSAEIAGAVMHSPLADDFGIYYEAELLARVAAVVREVKPDIMLIPSLEDYMEDHQNAARLLVTAAFVRAMPNFRTSPNTPTFEKQVVVYHALPYGLRDGMRRRVRAEIFADISGVMNDKRGMLSCHRSQKEWLDLSQGLDSYIKTMEEMSREVGGMSGRFEFAEGWRRHSSLGFCAEDYNPLPEMLGEACLIDAGYGKSPG